jgi:hypothetical protein
MKTQRLLELIVVQLNNQKHLTGPTTGPADQVELAVIEDLIQQVNLAQHQLEECTA